MAVADGRGDHEVMLGESVAAGVAGALLVAGLGSGCGAQTEAAEKVAPSSAATAPARLNGIDVVPIGTPCHMAVRGDATDIAAASEAPVYLPSNGADDVTEAWRCGDTPVFMFGDVQLSFESGYENVEGRQKAEDLADGLGGSVQSIQGISSVVVADPNDELLMIKDGTAIRLLAAGNVPIERLVELAASLDLAHAIN